MIKPAGAKHCYDSYPMQRKNRTRVMPILLTCLGKKPPPEIVFGTVRPPPVRDVRTCGAAKASAAAAPRPNTLSARPQGGK